MHKPEGYRPQYMRRNHAESAPQQIVAVHAEALWMDHPAAAGKRLGRLWRSTAIRTRSDAGGQQRTESIDFSVAEQFWDWLDQWLIPGRSVWLVAYQLGHQLTLIDFWRQLDAGRYRLDLAGTPEPGAPSAARWNDRPPRGVLILDDPPTIIKCDKDGRSLILVDTRNYWPANLAGLAELVGHPLLARPGDAGELADWEAYTGRCAQVVLDAFTALTAWWRREKLGHFRFSAPGLAIAAFRHRFLKEQILEDHDDAARQLGREALHGGQVVCGYVGPILPEVELHVGRLWGEKPHAERVREGPVYVLDCNSLYPAVMRDNYFPARFTCCKSPADLADVAAWRPYLCLVGKVELESHTHTYPVASHRQHLNCVGRFTTVLAGPELLAAVDRGHVRQVHALAAYGRGLLFREFVDCFYPKKVWAKQHGQDAEAELFKLILNGLPGKIAQRAGGWRTVDLRLDGVRWGPFPYYHEPTQRWYDARAVAGIIQLRQEAAELIESFPLITAYVNSFARLEMERVRQLVAPAPVWYQDTDSVHTNADGFARLLHHGLIDPERLGAFRVERIVERAEYRGAKDYTHDGRHFVSGRKTEARQVAEDRYVQDEWQGLHSILSVKPTGLIEVSDTEKTIGKLHPSARMARDGTCTPLILWDGELITSSRRRLPWEPAAQRRRTRDAQRE